MTAKSDFRYNKMLLFQVNNSFLIQDTSSLSRNDCKILCIIQNASMTTTLLITVAILRENCLMQKGELLEKTKVVAVTRLIKRIL